MKCDNPQTSAFLLESKISVVLKGTLSGLRQLNGMNISEKDINQMSYQERCDTFNNNPLLVVRHFQVEK